MRLPENNKFMCGEKHCIRQMTKWGEYFQLMHKTNIPDT